jgi:NAD(P)-dependent dehydrogenase (short-subunit alcohol dehydrogenase family)
MMTELSGLNILVTGASSGIGKAIAVHCSSLGARIIGVGRDMTRLEETSKALKPGDHVIRSVDLTDHLAVTRLMDELKKLDVVIHGLVHAAGISGTHPLQVINEDKLANFISVNITAAVRITQAVTKKNIFAPEGGAIIWITSVMAHAGESGKSLYALTKGALTAAARSLAIELAPRKIRVNCVAPGVVVTPMVQHAYYSQDEESLNRIKALHPLGLGEPEDVASAVAFLVSPAAKWITGVTLAVDGGYLAR